MSEPSVEEIVARVELDLGRPPDPHEPDEAFVGGIIYVGELRAVIASWRERGEALKPFADAHFYYNDAGKPDDLPTGIGGVTYGDFRRAVSVLANDEIARAALKDKP